MNSVWLISKWTAFETIGTVLTKQTVRAAIPADSNHRFRISGFPMGTQAAPGDEGGVIVHARFTGDIAQGHTGLPIDQLSQGAGDGNARGLRNRI